MKEPKFSPGPWEKGVCLDVRGPWRDGQYGEIAHIRYNDSKEEEEANFDLVSTAPELYEVLSELEESSAYWSEYDVPIGIQDRIKNVLKKARGE